MKNLKVKNTEQRSEDYLRFGIIEFENGHFDTSWKYVSQALRIDSEIVERKHAYESYIHRIIRKHFGSEVSISAILNKYKS
jgi:hypothetical protein